MFEAGKISPLVLEVNWRPPWGGGYEAGFREGGGSRAAPWSGCWLQGSVSFLNIYQRVHIIACVLFCIYVRIKQKNSTKNSIWSWLSDRDLLFHQKNLFYVQVSHFLIYTFKIYLLEFNVNFYVNVKSSSEEGRLSVYYFQEWPWSH